jgi:hypothetical protein
MGEVVTVGLDIAKSVFQVHGVDAEGQVVVQRKLTRAKLIPFFEKLPPCRIGIGACATAHHWGRRLTEVGHEVKLMPGASDPGHPCSRNPTTRAGAALSTTPCARPKSNLRDQQPLRHIPLRG